MRIPVLTAVLIASVGATAAVGAALLPEAPDGPTPGDLKAQAAWAQLKEAAFTRSDVVAADIDVSAPPLQIAQTGTAVDAGVVAPLAQPAYTGTGLDRASALSNETFVPGKGMARWQVAEVAIARSANAVDVVRTSIGQIARTPMGLPPRPGDRLNLETGAYEVTYTRGWPGAASIETAKFDVAVTPHVGVGISNAGTSAEAGAVVKLEKRALALAGKMGVRDGKAFGDQGRWYLFAAASGRAVGLNVLRNDNGWSRAGFSTDPTAMISDFQAGLAWRKGAMQASFGWLKRKIRGEAPYMFGATSRSDSVVALTVSIKPHKK